VKAHQGNRTDAEVPYTSRGKKSLTKSLSKENQVLERGGIWTERGEKSGTYPSKKPQKSGKSGRKRKKEFHHAFPWRFKEGRGSPLWKHGISDTAREGGTRKKKNLEIKEKRKSTWVAMEKTHVFTTKEGKKGDRHLKPRGRRHRA